MRDVAAELRLYGMQGAWEELVAQGDSAGLQSARWLVEHLMEAEHTDRALRSVRYQLHAAKFPMHPDMAGFDFTQSRGDRALMTELADLFSTAAAHNVVFIGGTSTGKTHLATALGVCGITQHGKRVRFYSTVDETEWPFRLSSAVNKLALASWEPDGIAPPGLAQPTIMTLPPAPGVA